MDLLKFVMSCRRQRDKDCSVSFVSIKFCKMTKRLFITVLHLLSFGAIAQQVPRAVIAEHFTNTYCSICAANNPALYGNLTSYPEVIHIAYYPSAPYVACPLSMANPTEQDARTNYYGVYGGTPKLVIGGVVQTAPYTSGSIYATPLTYTSSFELHTMITPIGTDSVRLDAVVKKVDASTLTSLQLYSAVVEDTLFFTAHNGETKHFDVFRKSFWGTTSLSISAPAATGDSVSFTKTIALNSAWNISRLSAISILQGSDKAVVQASRSGHLPPGTGVDVGGVQRAVTVYPNPTTGRLVIGSGQVVGQILITDMAGRTMDIDVTAMKANTIDVSGLVPGVYLLSFNEGSERRRVRFEKR
jgi:hypothetical protein